jgi:hypothetical protein
MMSPRRKPTAQSCLPTKKVNKTVIPNENRKNDVINGSFILAKFVSETACDSDTQHSLLYLPWPPWAAQHKIEMIPWWPRQVKKTI